MTTLLYRGHAYQQVKDAAQQQGVQLTYRRNVYQARQADVRSRRRRHALAQRYLLL